MSRGVRLDWGTVSNYAKSHTVRDTASHFKCTTNAVHAILRELKQETFKDELKCYAPHMRELRECGFSIPEIAVQIRCKGKVIGTFTPSKSAH